MERLTGDGSVGLGIPTQVAKTIHWILKPILVASKVDGKFMQYALKQWPYQFVREVLLIIPVRFLPKISSYSSQSISHYNQSDLQFLHEKTFLVINSSFFEKAKSSDRPTSIVCSFSFISPFNFSSTSCATLFISSRVTFSSSNLNLWRTK